MNKLLGGGMILTSAAIFSYYTAWVFVVVLYFPMMLSNFNFQQKIPKDHPLQRLFLDKELAVSLPLFLLALFVAFLFLYILRYELKVKAERNKKKVT